MRPSGQGITLDREVLGYPSGSSLAILRSSSPASIESTGMYTLDIQKTSMFTIRGRGTTEVKGVSLIFFISGHGRLTQKIKIKF